MLQNIKKLGFILIIISITLLVTLSIIKVKVDAQEAFLCEVVHSTPGLDIKQCPAHQSNLSWLITIIFSITLLILGAGVYISFIPKISLKNLKPEFKEIDISKLDNDEKTIYNIIKDNQGSTYQTDLIKETGYSKVKITRILDKLEQKDVLERKRRGMTNIIVLK